jgi:hypothetical protein
MSDYIVIRSAFIERPHEAVDYYAARLAGARVIACHGRNVEIHFEADGTHLFSEDVGSIVADHARIVRRVKGGRIEVRQFALERARLLDQVVTAIERFTVSIPGSGGMGREKRLLHGPRLPDGQYLRVVLRPGPGKAWTCVTAYPVSEVAWREAVRARRARFPPEE